MAVVTMTKRDMSKDGTVSVPLRQGRVLPLVPTLGGVALTLSNVKADCRWSLSDDEARDLAIQLNTHFAKRLRRDGYKRTRFNTRTLPTSDRAPRAEIATSDGIA